MPSIQSLPAELLDSILQNLSMQDLLLDQRVCKQWHQVIKQSPRLQRNIFLGFVPSRELSEAELSRFVHDNTRTPRPSSSRQYGQVKLEAKQGQGKEGHATSPASTHSSGPIVNFNQVFPSEGDVIRMMTMQFRTKPQSGDSWLDMYLTQPPCSQAEATVYFKRSSGSGFRIFGRKSDTATCVVRVVKANGVRARDILEAARESPASKTEKWQRIDICVPGVVHG